VARQLQRLLNRSPAPCRAGADRKGEAMRIAKQNSTIVLAVAIALMGVSLAGAELDQAMTDYKSGKYAEAAAGFQALVDRAPSYDYGYFMLGLSYFKLGKNDDAIENINKAIELNGDKFNYYHALASVQRAKKQNREALKVLNDAEGLLEDNSKFAFYSVRGFVNADLEKWSDAVDDLEKARALKSSAAILEYLGRSYYKLGYADKAVPVLREATRHNPNNANVQLLLADSLINLARETTNDAEKKKLFSEALQVATKYRNMKPDDYYAVNLVGKAALGAQAYNEAEQAFKKVLELKPDYCYAMVNLAKTYIAGEKWVAAEKTSRDATRCAPRLTAGYESLGYALQKQKKLDEALEAYKQAQSIKRSASVDKLIEVVAENIRRRDENLEMDEAERAQREAAEAEARRIAEEEAKQLEWEKKQDD
jgi:predicted Zn-dependent protease